MPLERTFSIIKPDGVRKRLVGEIYSRFINAGLNIVANRMTQLSKQQAQEFYAVHKEKPFYDDLITYMTSGPVFVQVLEGENAIEQNRRIMGATDPDNAEKGTIRGDFGEHKGSNVVHGADGPDTAKMEIAFFFNETEIYTSPESTSEGNIKAVA